jgi:peptidoglycan-associated lipoprotein
MGPLALEGSAMKLNRHGLLILFVAVLLVATMSACKKQAPETEPVPAPDTTQQQATPPEPPDRVEVTENFPEQRPEVAEIAEVSVAELNEQGVLKTIFFDFDKYDLSDNARGVLRNNAAWMTQNSNYYVVIEGHCDERGTIEYNLALGERRAKVVRDYLADLGVDRGRLRVVSYGEEKPADPGHTDEAWAQNRRAEFVIER